MTCFAAASAKPTIVIQHHNESPRLYVLYNDKRSGGLKTVYRFNFPICRYNCPVHRDNFKDRPFFFQEAWKSSKLLIFLVNQRT